MDMLVKETENCIIGSISVLLCFLVKYDVVNKYIDCVNVVLFCSSAFIFSGSNGC